MKIRIREWACGCRSKRRGSTETRSRCDGKTPRYEGCRGLGNGRCRTVRVKS